MNFITPYRLVTIVLSKLHIQITKKHLGGCLPFAKKILARLRAAGYDDVEITQIIDYTCQGMLREGTPRSFQYFGGIINNWLDRVASQPLQEVKPINEFIPKKEKDVDNPV